MHVSGVSHQQGGLNGQGHASHSACPERFAFISSGCRVGPAGKAAFGGQASTRPIPFSVLERPSGGGRWEQGQLSPLDSFSKSGPVSTILEAGCCHDGC